MHTFTGTFAVVELMIGNSIQRVLHSDPTLEVCIDDYNITNSTIDCDAVKINVAITLAFSSGLIMVNT